MSARRPRRHGLTQGATSLAAIGAAALAAERSQSARRHTRSHPRLAVTGSADRLFVRNFSPFVSGGISRRRDRRAARRRHTRARAALEQTAAKCDRHRGHDRRGSRPRRLVTNRDVARTLSAYDSGKPLKRDLGDAALEHRPRPGQHFKSTATWTVPRDVGHRRPMTNRAAARTQVAPRTAIRPVVGRTDVVEDRARAYFTGYATNDHSGPDFRNASVLLLTQMKPAR